MIGTLVGALTITILYMGGQQMGWPKWVQEMVIGGIIIAITDVETLRLWGEDPGEAFGQTITGIFDAYRALFAGSIGSPGWRC